METLGLPLTPGSATGILHPFNVLRVSHAVLRHALSAFNPDTAVVRRTHHRSRSHAGVTESRFGAESVDGVGDAASVVSSHQSRRSARSAAGVPSSERPHRRHRSDSGDPAATLTGQRRHRHSSAESDKNSRGANEGVPAASASRRTRSAEEPLVMSRRASTDSGSSSVTNALGSSGSRVRRSHSDSSRSRATVSPGDQVGLGSGRTRVANAPVGSSLVPPLAPPPPVTDIGKPPLSSRRLSSSGTAASTPDVATRSRHRHHRSGSGGGLSSSSHRSSRSHRSDNSDDNAGSSVIVIHDGEAVPLRSKMAAWSPTSWWQRTRAKNVTRTAYLIDHVIHAVPVAIVHYCCELKRQLATLPLLRFSDLLPSPGTAKPRCNTYESPESAVAATWLPTEGCFEMLPAPHVAHLLFMRWMLAVTESYIEKLFFDQSLVVRQLRSKRTRRRLLGWGLRLVSHTVFDPFLLSIVVPLLLSWGATFNADNASSLLPSPPPRVLFTVSGAVRGLVMSAAGVTIQQLLMPLASHLVDRAVLTFFEAVEYLIMRRYARWSDDDDDEDYSKDDNDEDDRASLASGVSEVAGCPQNVSMSVATIDPSEGREGGAATLSAEKHVDHVQRRLRREQRKRRERRKAEREHAMRLAILRAIVYRVVASLAAQSLIDHPLSVLVELLRGRATLHFTGLLQPYATMTAANDGLSWKALWRYALQLADPTVAVRNATKGRDADEEGVPAPVTVLRRAGRAITQEVVVISSSVLAASGQTEAIAAVQQRAAQTVAQGGIPSAADSADFLIRTLLSLSPFYYGVQFTVIDKVLSFYMAVWTRLTKQ